MGVMEEKMNLLQIIDKISKNKNCYCKDWNRRDLLELIINSFSEGRVERLRQLPVLSSLDIFDFV